MPVIYRDDNKSHGQKTPAKLGNELTKTITTIHPAGQQVHKGAGPMQTSPDFWETFVPTKKERL